MFKFKLEPELSLLTATRTGFWSLETVDDYELALRAELAGLRLSARPTAFIIDIRASGAQAQPVANALRGVVGRLGSLHADRTAIVTISGIAKLQAARVASPEARVFLSMAEARSWILGDLEQDLTSGPVHDEASDAAAQHGIVHVQGPDHVDILLTPRAALETSRRIGDAAIEAILSDANDGPHVTP